MFTTSNNNPQAQESIEPLNPNDYSESHCTKAFGPAAQNPAEKS